MTPKEVLTIKIMNFKTRKITMRVSEELFILIEELAIERSVSKQDLILAQVMLNHGLTWLQDFYVNRAV